MNLPEERKQIITLGNGKKWKQEEIYAAIIMEMPSVSLPAPLVCFGRPKREKFCQKLTQKEEKGAEA